MKIVGSELNGAFVVESEKRADPRGSFARLFCEEELKEILGQRQIVQINHSVTVEKGAVRGFHFQNPPHAEMKFVRCLRGKVWDVAVDLRQNSPTFLKWQAVELSPENNRMFVIPEGFAHGFQTLTADCELLYLHTAHYEPKSEGGVRFDEPRLNVSWPLPVTEMSERDRTRAFLDKSFGGIAL
jgi:dTDP-4-dehydrorhamnose 3,5-epimerase